MWGIINIICGLIDLNNILNVKSVEQDFHLTPSQIGQIVKQEQRELDRTIKYIRKNGGQLPPWWNEHE